MQGVKLAEVEAFLQQVEKLSVEDFSKVNKAGKAVRPAQYSAEQLLRLSAADFQWLISRSQDVVSVQLRDPDCSDRLGCMLTTLVQEAAQAIVRRDRLSMEQYEAFVGGFRSVGVAVPDHPSEE